MPSSEELSVNSAASFRDGAEAAEFDSLTTSSSRRLTWFSVAAFLAKSTITFFYLLDYFSAARTADGRFLILLAWLRRTDSAGEGSAPSRKTRHNRTPPNKLIVFLLSSSFFCPFVLYCFKSTLSSTPSKSQQNQAGITLYFPGCESDQQSLIKKPRKGLTVSGPGTIGLCIKVKYWFKTNYV